MSDVLHAVVAALYFYPVKACAGQRVQSLQFTEQGPIEGDRQWVVVNGDQEVVWQGSHPRLSLVHTRTVPGLLHLSGPEGQALTVHNPPTAGACQVKIWSSSLQQNETFEGMDAGDAAAALLQHITGAALRLVRLETSAWVRVTINHCHIASSASLSELDATQTQLALPRVEIERFRPNILLAGAPSSPLAPFVEEYCTHLRWLDAGRMAELTVQAEPCIRCIVPNVNPRTAAVSGQPLETITRLSAERHPGKPVYFGIYADAHRAATLREGAQLNLILNF